MVYSTAAWLFGDARIARSSCGRLVPPGTARPPPAVVVDRAPRDSLGADPDRFMAFVRRASGSGEGNRQRARPGDPELRGRVREALAALGGRGPRVATRPPLCRCFASSAPPSDADGEGENP
jgi:hypothetical protein